MRALLLGLVASTLALLALVVPAGPAGAHGDDPQLQVRLDSVEGAPEDLTVQVRSTISEQMLVANPSATPLRVLDPTGRPFVEVSEDGVRADVANAFFYRTLGPPDAPVAAPPSATRGGSRSESEPRWRLVTTESSWGWFDPRLHPQDVGTGLGVVARWEVPLLHGDQELVARGSLVREEVLGTWSPGPVEAPDGVTVQLLPGKRPALALTRGAARTVSVQDAAGETVLRLDGTGIALDPLSDAALTTSAVTSGDLREGLVPVGGGAFHAWLDARVQPLAQPEDPRRPSVQEWQIPVVVDGEQGMVTGEWRWEPVEEAPLTAPGTLEEGTWLPLTGGVLGVALLGAVGMRLAPRRTRLTAAAPGRSA